MSQSSSRHRLLHVLDVNHMKSSSSAKGSVLSKISSPSPTTAFLQEASLICKWSFPKSSLVAYYLLRFEGFHADRSTGRSVRVNKYLCKLYALGTCEQIPFRLLPYGLWGLSWCVWYVLEGECWLYSFFVEYPSQAIQIVLLYLYMTWISSLLCFTYYRNKNIRETLWNNGELPWKITFFPFFYFASYQSADVLRHVIFQSFHVPIGPMETLLFL